MKTTFNTVTLLLATLLYATVVSGRQVRGTNEQQQVEQGSSSITDSLLSWIRRDQEVVVEPVAAEDGVEAPVSAAVGKRSEIRARPEIVGGGLSKVFDEFRNWEGPTKAEKEAAKAEKEAAKAEKKAANAEKKAVAKEQEAEVEAMGGEAQQKGEKKQAGGDGGGKNAMKWNMKKVVTEGDETRRRDLRSDNADAYAKGAQSRGRHEGVGNSNFWRKSGLNKFRNEDRRRLVMS